MSQKSTKDLCIIAQKKEKKSCALKYDKVSKYHFNGLFFDQSMECLS